MRTPFSRMPRSGWVSIVRVLALSVWFGAGMGTLHAYVSYVNSTGQPQKWNLTAPSTLVSTNVVNRSTRAVRYFLSADAYSAAHRDAELNAARACFDQWQAVGQSILRFEEGGLATGQLDVNTSDNTNLIFWAKTSTIVNGGFDSISGATAVTFSDYFSDASLAEADIVLNGVDYTWFTDFSDKSNAGYFVESVLLHEIGHLIGLAHSPIGAATMFPRGGPGVSVQAGLSLDEISAVHALYPAPSFTASWGTLAGTVTLQGGAVLGAVVTAEDGAGNIAAGTVTRANGQYQMPALVPGAYQIRVSPVDPGNASFFLFRGSDVSSDFTSAAYNFAPSAPKPATVSKGGTTQVNFALSGTPAIRIARLQPPTDSNAPFVVVNYPSAVGPGPADTVVGIYTTTPLSSSATLQVTGNGLTLGAATYLPNAFTTVNPPLNRLSVPLHVGPEATPGMRSLLVQDGTNVAYANGFLEVAPAFPDYNFDGLDDRFQRAYFRRWTAPDAAPGADPDHDGYNNQAEFISGTDPTDPNSILRVSTVRLDASGTTVRWPSAPGKRYQVLSRTQINSIRGWQPVGDPVVATGATAEFLDSSATSALRFYRIQALP